MGNLNIGPLIKRILCNQEVIALLADINYSYAKAEVQGECIQISTKQPKSHSTIQTVLKYSPN